MVEKKSWDEFRSAGLLWWANRVLHLMGWAIVVTVDDSGKTTDAYPARVKFRGFSEDCETDGHEKLTDYLCKNSDELYKECQL